MLKLKYDPEYGTFEIEQNDRGAWVIDYQRVEHGVTVLQGYGLENTLTIIDQPVGPGNVDFVLVHSSVDNWNKVAQKVAPTDADIPDTLASLLAEVCAYDPLEGPEGNDETVLGMSA